MARLFIVCAIVIVLSAAARSVRAGASASASITYSGSPAGGGSDGPNTGATQAQASVTDAANLAKSQADSWTLKTYASLDLLAGQSDGQAVGIASYTDSITVSASDPGTVTFAFQVHGTLSPGSDYTLTGRSNGDIVDNPTWFYEDPNIDSLWGFSVAFTPGVPFDFQLEARSRALQATGGTGAVVSDFFSTTSLDSIVLDVPEATIAGQSGFVYQSFVPEPCSLALLALAGLSARRRR